MKQDILAKGFLLPTIHVLDPQLTLDELPEVRFEFPFILIGKWTKAFLTGHSWRVLKSWYTGGRPEQEFRNCFADGLNQCLVSSVAQANKQAVLQWFWFAGFRAHNLGRIDLDNKLLFIFK